jgi:mannitol/fructose-specific phosphotransferase system IIA component (Ntr-type)
VATQSLAELVHPDQLLELTGDDKSKVLRELVRAAARSKGQPAARIVMRGILDREDLRPTGIGEGIAIPHCKLSAIKRYGIAIGRTQVPIDYGAPDDEPVRVLALISAPNDNPSEYLRVLSTVTRFIKDKSADLLAADDVKKLHQALGEYRFASTP